MAVDRELTHAWRVFGVIEGRSPTIASVTDPRIASSWRRCVETHNLDPNAPSSPNVVDAAQLIGRRCMLDELQSVSKRVIDRLARQLVDARHAVFLADPDGVIVECRLPLDRRREFDRLGLLPGASWCESLEGTNGIGTCAIERSPVIICQHDHFRARHTSLTCTASPIFAPSGELVAILDVSVFGGDVSRTGELRTLSIVNLAASSIENNHFEQCFRDEWLLLLRENSGHFWPSEQAMLAFDDGGCVLAANKSALHFLGTSRVDIVGTRIDHWFRQPLDALMERALPQPQTYWLIDTKADEQLLAMVRGPSRAVRLTFSVPAGYEVKKPAMPFQDSHLALEFSRACQVFEHDVPVLISGETGSGKEVFARAVHANSDRAGRPFISVNCAAIPETLIESELFGYDEGSFTGAKKGGMSGKLSQANGGTLFLDEIGDMPFAMQTRLLRVLEERTVSPLGCGEPVALDIRVVSATHRDLKVQIADRQFREDLYYRLAGLEVTIPPLRNREDKVEILQHLLEEANLGEEQFLTNEAKAAMCGYSWPGNVRQMRNMLRTMVALSRGGNITLADLPAEIREQGVRDPCSPLDVAERKALCDILDACQGQVSAAARRLGVSRNTLYRKLKRLGLWRP